MVLHQERITTDDDRLRWLRDIRDAAARPLMPSDPARQRVLRSQREPRHHPAAGVGTQRGVRF